MRRRAEAFHCAPPPQCHAMSPSNHRKNQEKRANKDEAKRQKEWLRRLAVRELEEAAHEAQRRAALTEEERAAEDAERVAEEDRAAEHERLMELKRSGNYHLDPQQAHEEAVDAGDAAHVSADEEYYKWTLLELKQLLEANDQLKGGTKAVLVARCADGKLYGGLPRCPQCGGGKLKVRYTRTRSLFAPCSQPRLTSQTDP